MSLFVCLLHSLEKKTLNENSVVKSDEEESFNHEPEFDVTHLHLSVSLHGLGTGSPPLWRGGALESEPRPHTAAVKADRLFVFPARSRSHQLVSVQLSCGPLGLF